jgi:hypothetical protein
LGFERYAVEGLRDMDLASLHIGSGVVRVKTGILLISPMWHS